MTTDKRRIKIQAAPLISLIAKILRARKDGFTREELQEIALDLLEMSMELVERSELGR